MAYNGGVQLKVFEVNEEIFNKILYDYEEVVIVEPLDEWYCGYKGKRGKNIITYNGTNELICKEYILNGYCGNITNCTSWKQCRIRKVENAITEVSDSLSGSTAYKHVYHNILRKEYTEKEIDDILHSFEREESNIFHLYPSEWMDRYEITKVENCFYYDINSAYMDALAEIFPKCANSFNTMYLERKTKPINKKYANYFCGMLCRRGYRKTFNWITNRTYEKLTAMMDLTGGTIIYANTDGYFITDPKNIIPTNKNLGGFKLELNAGDVYLYADRNYWVMQYTNSNGENEFKGTILCSLRKEIDLSTGDIVHYTLKTHPVLKYRYAENIIKENLNNGK